MKKSFKQGLILGGVVTLSALAIKRYQQSCSKDQSISHTAELDQRPSVDAKTDETEVGLTQLDSIQRADWQANGFPQTHAELERLEKEENQ
ncbi:hypothetical protein D3D03_05565 [Exiguobacterium sp. RIT452]|uniref:hypothetical protein n=1 Tax=unclassified Exiguobacterium TaxID=2644629 RepID=UPI000E7337CE|nr:MULTISPECIES: hypothetical protein [unclassified Exiguobacterium]RJP00257.1 hypothetical protein D3D03_05565 [Exiguobacterium sp. RIT452]